MAENPHGACVRPSNVAMITSPSTGCAFWRLDERADELARERSRRLEYGSPEARAVRRERARLERILQLGERARLPHGIWVEVADRRGFLTHTGIPADRRDVDPAAVEAEIERLGVNAAIRAGRL
jgi:hypothetical protein